LPREGLPPRRLIAQWHPDQSDWRAAPILYILALLHSHTGSGGGCGGKDPLVFILVLSLAPLTLSAGGTTAIGDIAPVDCLLHCVTRHAVHLYPGARSPCWDGPVDWFPRGRGWFLVLREGHQAAMDSADGRMGKWKRMRLALVWNSQPPPGPHAVIGQQARSGASRTLWPVEPQLPMFGGVGVSWSLFRGEPLNAPHPPKLALLGAAVSGSIRLLVSLGFCWQGKWWKTNETNRPGWSLSSRSGNERYKVGEGWE
jgi:hypothetical protein